MCGRYRRTTREEELARIYRIPIPSQPDLPISYNIAPSQEVLAIRLNPETKQRSLDRLRWGLVPYWATCSDPNCKGTGRRFNEFSARDVHIVLSLICIGLHKSGTRSLKTL